MNTVSRLINLQTFNLQRLLEPKQRFQLLAIITMSIAAISFVATKIVKYLSKDKSKKDENTPKKTDETKDSSSTKQIALDSKDTTQSKIEKERMDSKIHKTPMMDVYLEESISLRTLENPEKLVSDKEVSDVDESLHPTQKEISDKESIEVEDNQEADVYEARTWSKEPLQSEQSEDSSDSEVEKSQFSPRVRRRIQKLKSYAKSLRTMAKAIRFEDENIRFKKRVELNRIMLKEYSASKNVQLPEGKLDIIPIPLHRANPCYKEYSNNINDIMRSRIEKKTISKNSLFLHRTDLEPWQKRKIIRTAQNMKSLSFEEEPGRFEETEYALTKPVIDHEFKVVYKSPKNPAMESFAFALESIIEKSGLSNIILPRREIFTRRFDPTDPDRKTSVFVEECIDNLVGFFDAIKLYETQPKKFDSIVASFAKLACSLEIGDLMINREKRNSEYGNADIKIVDGKVIDSGNLSLICCNFDNLVVQRVINDNGEETYNFVLVDIDVVRKPDHTTVESLMLMFPSHRQLIVDVILRNNPSLLEGYNPYCSMRCDTIQGNDEVFSKEEQIDKYKEMSEEIRIKRDRDRELGKSKIEQDEFLRRRLALLEEKSKLKSKK